MSCDFCDDDMQAVVDRNALVDFVAALIDGDMSIARIMAGRAFEDGDVRAIEHLLARTAVRRAG